MDEYQVASDAPFQERLAQVRHDLKTPVGHILGYSEMLEEEFEDDPWDEFTQDLKNILSSGAKLVALIEEHLGPSKTNIDQVDFANTQFQLRLQLNHITGYCEMLRELAQEEGRDSLLPDLDKINQASLVFSRIVEQSLVPSALEPTAETSAESGQREKSHINEVDLNELLHLSRLGEGGEILVVDDNLVNLDLLSRRLGRQGYKATSVDSGDKALAKLKQDKFDLILLDMQMPGLSGLDVLAILKKDSVLRNIPVIILSALDDMSQIVNCVLLGADDYIFKPFNPILLKARISASLEKARLRRQVVPKLKIFISSPGDVIPERKLVRLIINQLNEELVDQVYLTPIFWEDEPLLASDTFQAQIYPAQDSDIYIGIFWSRLGSPLPENIRRPDGSRYLSGSEYEFEDAMAGFKSKGRPEILFYRKTTEPLVGLNDRALVMEKLEQNNRLEHFVKHWFMTDDGDSYIGAFHCFNSDETFEQMVYSHLKKLVLKQLESLD